MHSNVALLYSESCLSALPSSSLCISFLSCFVWGVLAPHPPLPPLLHFCYSALGVSYVEMCVATGSPELGNKIYVHTDGKQQFRVKVVSRPGSELQTQTFQKFVHCCLDPVLFLCFSFHFSFPIWPYISTLLTPPEAQSLQHLYIWTAPVRAWSQPNDAHWMAVNHIYHLLTQVTSSSIRSCFSKMQRNLSLRAHSSQCPTLLESVF